MKKTYIILIGLFLITSSNLFAQCDCAAQGTGINMLQMPEDLQKKDIIGRFKLAALYKSLYGDKYFENTKESPAGMIEYFKVDYTNLFLTYYLNDKFTFFSDFGYYLNKEQKFRIGGSISGNGLSHISLGGRYSIFENQELGNELVYSLSSRFPLAKTDSTLPYHIQSSSGAIGFNTNLSYYQNLADNKLNLMLTLSYDYHLENENNYQFGDNKAIDLMAVYRLNPYFSISLGNKFELRENDKKYSENVLSGGTFSTLYPGIHIRYSDFLLSGIYELPIYRNTNSNQMVTSYSILFNLSWWFNL